MNAMQVSVFLENKSGRLVLVTRALKEAGINIRALCVADTAEFGILRFISDKPQEACKILKEAGMTVSLTEVIAVMMPDTPGGLNQIAELFDECGINLEYFYAYISRCNGRAVAICRVDDTKAAEKVLTDAGMEVVDEENLIQI